MPPNITTDSIRWIPLVGDFTIEDRRVEFHGSDLPPHPDYPTPGVAVGNLLSNRYFGGGRIDATITFSDSGDSSACGLMLFYEPSTQSFIEAQIGGYSVASVMTFTEGQWHPHGTVGFSGQIQAGRPYKISVAASGSRVTVSIDSVDVLTTNLPFPLPRGQAGIWCKSPGTIVVDGYTVTTERPRVFVIMQYTPPYNELYFEVIRPVCESMNFVALRADETYGPGLIVADIERQIIEAQIVVADITPQNANVYYEVGYAHAIKKPTILIADAATKLPFDVSPFRTLFYENSIAGKTRVEAGLKNHLEAISATGTLPPSQGIAAP